MPHKPVLLEQTIQSLELKSGDTVLDGTLGRAGHALEIIKHIGRAGHLIGMDQDPEALKACKETLKPYEGQVTLIGRNFAEAKEALESLNIMGLNAVILDVGTSSNQLEDPLRGFSFERPGPLDMRMNPEREVSASDLVNDLSQHDLEKIFWEYGEERWSRKFAEAIVKARARQRIETTDGLVDVLQAVLPHSLRRKEGKWSPKAKRHPATRVFQALRIAVNDELGVLERALPMLWELLEPGGRMSVISFHSLEDRIVKRFFRSLKIEKKAELIVKKPVVAEREEISENPRSRSAKLRAARKI